MTINIIRNNKLLAEIMPDDYFDFDFMSGDVLQLVNESNIATPDGCANVATKSGPVRIPATYFLDEHMGYLIPRHLCILTGAGVESLESIGSAHVDNYETYMGLSEEMCVLEIGSGIGRDAFILSKRYPKMTYVGVDCTADSIEWCNKNITKRFPSFQFRHVNAFHELYNPQGNIKTSEIKIPVSDSSIDRIFLGSVFTHLFEDEIIQYIKEFRRVLKPGGLVYANFFLYSEGVIRAARETMRSHNSLRFETEYGNGCYINDVGYPTGAVAFTEDAIHRMLELGGLMLLRPLLPGWWSSFFENAVDGQEVAIFVKADR